MKALLTALLFVLGVSIAQALEPPSVCNTEEQKRKAIMFFAAEHYNISAFHMNFTKSFPPGNWAKRIYGTEDVAKRGGSTPIGMLTP